MGDYPVDHHHFRHPQWETLPDLHFYPIPSFNVPIGVMIPKQDDVKDFIVAEKSISVSNLINGATRLQPVVMQIGQAAGALAALAVIEDKCVKEVSVRRVQEVLLDAGCYLMPYLDLSKDHPHFMALQRIGATGIMHGEGRNVGWSNQTLFRANDALRVEDLFVGDFFPDFSFEKILGYSSGEVTIAEFLKALVHLQSLDILSSIPSGVDEQRTWWESLNLERFSSDRQVTRLEAAVIIDALLNPFILMEVDYNGFTVRN